MIQIKRESKPDFAKTVRMGDLILIGDEPYMASFVHDGLYLIALSTGNRWSDIPLKEGTSEYDLIQCISDDENSKIELVKQNSFDLTVSIK